MLTSAETAAEAAKIAAAYPKMATYADEIVRVAGGLAKGKGVKPAWLANAINFESDGGDPAAINQIVEKTAPGTGASGLIQFVPGTAAELGTSLSKIRRMNGREQMKLVEAYFKLNRIPTVYSQSDIFMAIFYPYAIGKGPSYIIGSEKGPEYVARLQAQNPGIKTAADYTNYALKKARLPST